LNHIDVFSIKPTWYSKLGAVNSIFSCNYYIHRSHAAFLQALVSYLYKTIFREKKIRNVKIFPSKAPLKSWKRCLKTNLWSVGLGLQHFLSGFILSNIFLKHQKHQPFESHCYWKYKTFFCHYQLHISSVVQLSRLQWPVVFSWNIHLWCWNASYIIPLQWYDV